MWGGGVPKSKLGLAFRDLAICSAPNSASAPHANIKLAKHGPATATGAAACI
jgi:hypothetical protein